MAEAAKRRREQFSRCGFKCGDGVSVPGNYFFDSMPTFPSITGTIVKLLDGGGSVRVKWDVDKSETDVDISDIIQNITEADYELPGTGSSTEAAEEGYIPDDVDCVMSDDFDDVDECSYTLVNGKNGKNNGQKLFVGKNIPTKPNELVHNKLMKENEGKFEILEVLRDAQQWDGYDEDVHSVGSYVVWKMKKAVRGSETRKKKITKRKLLRVKTGKKSSRLYTTRKRKTFESGESEGEAGKEKEEKEGNDGKRKKVGPRRRVRKVLEAKKAGIMKTVIGKKGS